MQLIAGPTVTYSVVLMDPEMSHKEIPHLLLLVDSIVFFTSFPRAA